MAGTRRADDQVGGAVRVVLRGSVTCAPRCIRTAEGWEVASLVLGPVAARRGPAPCASALRLASRDPGLLAVCSGAGAARALACLGVGDEVIVRGRLTPRRAVRPEDDAVELVADAVLVRRRHPAGDGRTAEPRIGP